MKTIKAWHFLRTDGKLRDGTDPPPEGEWLEHHGPLVMCKSGLHASKRAIDALGYAPGVIACRVELSGRMILGNDRIVAEKRKIIARIDATEVFHHFARLCALDVVYLWDAPDVVVKYLKTGDESLRFAAAEAAARAARAARAAGDAAWAAGDAAWAAWDATFATRAAAWAARAAQNKRLTRLLAKALKWRFR